ncbi:hypothetical protein M9H77_16907 [Catharanthus roseus]|uniref:Uncharacterized protein n=1 Tax=Catharanthus roseus TaxID=4058 RepID=A0ACC0B331_CATRO|nr:hypothetical protein M9H77_16907 [Catharanthus roseus]
MDSEMRYLTDLLHQISTGPISKAREMHHLAKRVLITKGRKKTNSTKRDKSHWEHVSIAHQKIQSSSESGSGSGFGSGSSLGSGSRGKGRPPRAPRERGRGRACTFIIGLLTEQQHFIQVRL